MPFLAAAEHYEVAGTNNTSLRFLASPADPDGRSGANNDGADNPRLRYGRFTMVGFLRPEFNLADNFRVIDTSGNLTTASVPLPRAGADIVAQSVLSFDVQVFDQDAPVVVAHGVDDEPGIAGTDDDGNSTTDDVSELAWPESDDALLPLEDLSIQNAVLPTNPPPYGNANTNNSGSFVDLNYGLLAGHPLGSLVDRQFGPLNNLNLYAGYSGVAVYNTAAGFNAPCTATAAMQASGAIIINGGGTSGVLNSFFQSRYDTFTKQYQIDAFDQEAAVDPSPTDYGFVDSNLSITHRFDTDLSSAVTGTVVPMASRIWTPGTVSGKPYDPTGPTLELTTGRPVRPISPNFLDVSPPVNQAIKGLRIQIRMLDEATGQVLQRTIVHSFGRF